MIATVAPAPAGAGTPPAAGAEPEPLRTFIAANMPLLTSFTVVAGLAGFALTLQLGWFGPLLRFGLLLIGLVIWIELLDQVPRPLLLSNLRRYPAEYGWRLVGFAYLLQVLMVALLLYVAAAHPRLAAPAVAGAVAAWLASRLPERVGGLARVLLVLVAFEVALAIVSPEHRGVVGWLLEQAF